MTTTTEHLRRGGGLSRSTDMHRPERDRIPPPYGGSGGGGDDSNNNAVTIFPLDGSGDGSGSGDSETSWVGATFIGGGGDGDDHGGALATTTTMATRERVDHPRSIEVWDILRFLTEGVSEYQEHLKRLCRGDLSAPLRMVQLYSETPVGAVEFTLYPLLYRSAGPPGRYIVGLVGFVRPPVVPAPVSSTGQLFAELTARWIRCRTQMRRYIRVCCERIGARLGYQISWHQRPTPPGVLPLFNAASPLQGSSPMSIAARVVSLLRGGQNTTPPQGYHYHHHRYSHTLHMAGIQAA